MEKEKKEELTPQQKIAKLELELDHKMKHLAWFDYQKNGGRFQDRLESDLQLDRIKITEEIQELQNKLSDATSSD